MRRKALLMGMAVMTSLPGGVLAKGTGKSERLSHPYSGAWGNGYTLNIEQDGNDYGATTQGVAGTSGFNTTALLAQVKTMLLGKANASTGARELALKGWSVELTNQGGGTDAATGLREGKGINLGLAFRYTF